MKIGVCLSLGLWVLGCASTQTSDTAAGSQAREDANETLLPVDDLAENLLMRQHITLAWPGGRESFDSVLQKRGRILLLVGLGPMNAVGFSLTLDDTGITFENRSGRDMSFRPEHILADVQRVFYPWIDKDSKCVDCERRDVRSGIEIRERIGHRDLEERSFRDVARPERGVIVVRYEGWTKDSLIPDRAILLNGWVGYQLIVETTSVERLD
jgi:hypothetical protein